VRNTTHELLGVSCALATSRALELDALPGAAVVAASVCGSWLPDADQLGSRVHRRSRLERRSLLVGAAGALARLPLLAFAMVARHRGISHCPLACAALAALTAAAAVTLGPAFTLAAIGLTLGYTAHVLADACTPAGVELWRPFSSRRVHLLPAPARIPTGSAREALVAAGAGALALALALA
jgi:membrane-bound metal-dependent hydrolase YbcI (DUF457 family)